MTPRWQDVRLVARAAVVSMMMQARAESALYVDSGDKGQRKRARMVVEAIDAALARLAETTTAAERWRTVSRSAAAMDLVARLTEEAAAYKASGEQHEADALVRLMLLALAREAEGT